MTDTSPARTPHVLAAGDPGPVPAGAVLVADRLVRTDGADPAEIPCPAADLVAGELRRAGAAVVRGPLPVAAPGSPAPPGAVPAPAGAAAAVLTGTAPPAGIGLVPGPPAGGAESADPAGAARAAFAAWRAAAVPVRTVLLAAPRSFCAGVERAVEVVERALAQRGSPVYVRKQIVHNTHVVADLESRGAVFVEELDAVPEGATVVFSAHGVSPAVRSEAAARGLAVVDATCPLVTKVHTEARRYADRGDTVVLIGHAGHEEVEGTLGEAPERTVLVESAADVAALEVPDPERVSYLTQTTLAVDETAEVVDALRARFPALRGPASADICYATTNRQDALRSIAEDADLVLVVGSHNSSNSQRLVELARRGGTPAHLVDDTGDIRAAWLAGAATVGLTAGASAPPGLVEAVITALGGLGRVAVRERETTRETVRFTLPSAVRQP
ncbi:4-hydroxy-3-methylbut-2-enyl diphosphate reductase [Streptomonospora nanhaiensis]|uniref:4-hydroxy-3-methylbut-2-enyl diphosphate reductase n=1 Tax=Streptomonospora nanhaiensis TaxID=1323731 RepID=UPI001C391ACB|nr:4-hydroxy-3-methylbut-2-enyl diphosphate reductase [Streptomonospora nanhaiensis]MBV2366623.1 4-hydroxy-3-methylbut-2-enyl diphosphate reductase [Streptomonospora nanhaiensis]